ncbi:hypothetical protein NLJ89_g3324 [Agrocybe chaxingu]|uniref:Uncharacterized protein n=1 Tax=Agrocybe chaxingu TaxID=84603 RepID=A0A9W8K5H5_9AGAR|nr:hypothetical protein NLJ89_g3324 [Agrocybe chaxingu]
MVNLLKAIIKFLWPEQESKQFAAKAKKLIQEGKYDEGISFYEKALDASKPKYSTYSTIVFNYAMALNHAEADDRLKALVLFGKAFDVEKDVRSKAFPPLLLNYGFLSIDHARATKTATVLDDLVGKYQPLVEGPAGGSLARNAHYILGSALCVRQEIDPGSDVAQLGESIQHLERAVELSKEDNISLSRSLQSLATACNHRYESGKDAADLMKAIENNTRAIDVLRTVKNKESDIVLTQYNLARQHFAKYLEQSKKKEDLDEAQRVAKETKKLVAEIEEENQDLEQLLRVIAAHQRRDSTMMTMASGVA